MKIVTLYQPQYIDYNIGNCNLGVYFDNAEEANAYSTVEYGNYAVNSKPVKAISDGEGGFYLLQQETPVHLHNSVLDKENVSKKC